MAIAIFAGRNAEERKQNEWFVTDLKNALLALQPDLDLRIWPDIGNHDEIDFALVRIHPLGALKQFHHLKAIASLGAGVDHILIDPDLPPDVPIVRIMDPYMANDIVQYVVACLLNYVKRMDRWQHQQQQKLWNKDPPFNFSEKTIGIMGTGFLGSKAMHTLHQLGFHVIAWSNSPKEIAGIKHYTGSAEFYDFLSHADILVCMLPLTSKTINILNKEAFAHLPDDAFFINVGRGAHVVEEDLLAAINSGKLRGAALDVFRQEPLPIDHPFWSHPNIHITPHIASVTKTSSVAPQLIENYRRAHTSEPLLNQVDILKGY